MNPKWLKLAGQLLELASDKFSNHGCNDWEWPEGWSVEDRREFARAIAEEDGYDPEAYVAEGRYGPGDWEVMSFLAKRLEDLGDERS